MFEQKRVSGEVLSPAFLHNGKGVEYVTGNPTLDGSDFSNGDVVKAGTAIYKKDDGLYTLAENAPAPGEGETAGSLSHAVLTVDEVVIEDSARNYHVGAVSKGNITEALTTGVTDQFKESNRLFFWY